jgi:glycosyltransferase involved in cell wall biosynthesis
MSGDSIETNPSIGLCMIVKDEAHVIERCLDSVRPFVSRWTIVHTGSRDGTQEKIHELLADVPGELHERPWVDFAHNRSEALALAAPHSDFLLIIDADDVLEAASDFVMPRLTDDAYWLSIVEKNLRYDRVQLVRAPCNCRYEGVLHEYLTCDDEQSRGSSE